MRVDVPDRVRPRHVLNNRFSGGAVVDNTAGFVDLHCHLLPGVDDGAKSWEESLAMADIAVSDGIRTTIVTPHQMGTYGHNDGDMIRNRTARLQQFLHEHQVQLTVLPGADVRIEDNIVAQLQSGRVLTLADRGVHVLLELPHEVYFPMQTVLERLHAAGMAGILSHPERNQGLLRQPSLVQELVDQGCLMQVTAGSLMGTFGPHCQQMSEWMLRQGLVHFLATDAHGPRSRRPLMARSFERAAELTSEETARDLCCHNPAAVAHGGEVRRQQPHRGRGPWFPWRKVG
jgi:protein-tyrosine phosphatase